MLNKTIINIFVGLFLCLVLGFMATGLWYTIERAGQILDRYELLNKTNVVELDVPAFPRSK